MVDSRTECRLDRVFAAVADPTRRAILARLAKGPVTIGDLARPFSVSLNAISKHVKVLEGAGLVRRRVVGRRHFCAVEPKALDDAAAWLAHHRAFWSVARRRARAACAAAPPRAPGLRMKTIRQIATFKASPRAVYEALVDSRKHSAFTGMPARIDPKPGGRFTAYGDYLEGVTLELVPNKKIVQFWRSKNWPPYHYSTVTFALTSVRGGTRLQFTQQGVPNNDYRAKRSGWVSSYWDKLRAFLER